MNRLSAFSALALLGASVSIPAQGAIVITAPTPFWTTINLASGNPMDYLTDQQTGQSEGDIVGSSTQSGFYFWFDNGNTPLVTDGMLAFRIRVGSDAQNVGYQRAALVGIDANNDGALDLFVGVDNAGSEDKIKIWDTGTQANTSPSTTSITAIAPQKIYDETSANYAFTPVTATNDPVASPSFDIDADGNTDHFLSFALPFEDIVSEMSRLGGITIDQYTPLRFVLATSTQANAFNQDLGGVPKTYDSATTWNELGSVSSPYSPGGPAPDPDPVPEPGTLLAIGTGLVGIVLWRKRTTLN